MPRAAARKPKPKSKPPGKTGPDPIQFSREMRDEARRHLGNHQHVSKAAGELVKTFKFGIDLAYRLIDEARAEVIEELAGRGIDPTTGLFLFFESVMANSVEQTQHRISAAANIMKLLGLKRIMEKIGQEDVDGFLARLLKAQQTADAGEAAP